MNHDRVVDIAAAYAGIGVKQENRQKRAEIDIAAYN
jgi:hypothetical protein